MTIRTATATIDISALVDNFLMIKSLAPHSKMLAVLKANAYGHGLERIAKALPQADAFGVARIDEALALRAGGVVKPIVLLEGFFEAQDLPVLSVNNLQTIVHNEQQLTRVSWKVKYTYIHYHINILDCSSLLMNILLLSRRVKHTSYHMNRIVLVY